VSLTGVYYNRYLLEETWVLPYLAVVMLTALVCSSGYFSSVRACETANEMLEQLEVGDWLCCDAEGLLCSLVVTAYNLGISSF